MSHLSEDLLSDLLECECGICKNIWWVPSFEALGHEASLPRGCCFCLKEFDGFKWEEGEEDG